jgi:hypothetical protein
MFLRSFANLLFLFKVSRCDFQFVTIFNASIPQVNDGFGLSISLVAKGDTFFTVTGYTSTNAVLYASSDGGKSWSFFQLFQYGEPCIQQTRSSFSKTGDELIINGGNGAMLYNYDRTQYYPGIIVDPYSLPDTCTGGTTDPGVAVSLSGDGRWAFDTDICYESTGYYGGIIYVTDIIEEITTKNVELPCPEENQGCYSDIMVTNDDGSILVIGVTGYAPFIRFVLLYQREVTSYGLGYYVFGTLYDESGDENCLYFGKSISFSADGSTLAIGSCGYVLIYILPNLNSPSQNISSLDSQNEYNFYNVDLSDDGSRLIIGGGNGFAYSYVNYGGIFVFESILTTPVYDPSFGSGGIAVINTPENEAIVLVGGSTAGIGKSGQIAVFKSFIPSASASVTATASSSSTSSSTSSSSSSATSTFSSSSSATATSTLSSTATSSATISPTSSTVPNSPPNNALTANAATYEITAGIAVSGGIVGALIGFYLYNFLRSQTRLGNVESINSAEPMKTSLLYSS